MDTKNFKEKAKTATVAQNFSLSPQELGIQQFLENIS